MDITKEAWISWRHDPVTKLYLGMVKELRENIKENLARDFYKDSELIKVIGQALAIDMVLGMEPDFIDEDRNDPPWK